MIMMTQVDIQLKVERAKKQIDAAESARTTSGATRTKEEIERDRVRRQTSSPTTSPKQGFE
jgi:hypothetical protein